MKVSTNVPMGPDSRLHHIGLGVQLAGTPVSLLIKTDYGHGTESSPLRSSPLQVPLTGRTGDGSYGRFR
jgi:hypothetical protein